VRARSQAATAGTLLAACALALLCLALPASAKVQHHRDAGLGERKVLIHGHHHRLGQLKVPSRRHHVGVAERRAVVNRQGPPVAQEPGWVILPSPNVSIALPVGQGKSASPRSAAVTLPREPVAETPVAREDPPIVVPLAPPEETPPPPVTPVEETPPVTAPPVEPPAPPVEEPALPPTTPPEEPPPTAPEEPLPTPPKSAVSSVYWGASIGDQLTGEQAPWDMGAVSKFEETAGKKLSLVNFFSPFANCSGSSCSFYPFPTGVMEDIREHGAIPVFSWSSQSIPSSLNEPDFQLGDVIDGTYDSYIREFAEAARDWGHPFFLRFNWEMNGGWFSWSEGTNGNQQGESVAAWRHVHDIFKSVGATNATWVWCPNVDPDNIFQNLSSLYPGDEYVDWTGLDGYNWGTNPAKPDRWRSFDELYGSTYQRITSTVAPSKPLLIGEIGSTEFGGSKANWISTALTEIPTAYPKIRGLLWFDTFDDGMDWPIESSSSATSAFAAGIESPAYATSAYAGLSGGSIQPPG
jgi:mannan endo-1,4-beta-mannosidase